ncbi:DNA cytosine methyltransferase [Bacillus haynesii]|uniref:DNA cytosine methyltransferase n=1 Tax=Bacillus haynesii TaxID=1925021 RepID=UPI001F61BF2E|nr:DNA cytosine methyltransferase [Bacillus haynesii]MCI4127742.1 DNA cytosine methyltransferase [Bacillus haynesii]MCY8348291.1 DNA cytosine methyltransferase [Bacillus haynesii]MCY8557530.1 DNA cytosine methyltransferase [Bacillus haynesii]MCY9223501.1 DNA cytosine methyltransferase [Bacillus haynesii]
MKKTLKVLDLFAGGGGFSTGFLQANHPNLKFEITKAVEINQAASDTLRGHLGPEKVIQGDITNSNVKKEIFQSCGDIDVVIGGPPCQTFSLAGPARSGTKEMREKLKNDPRNTLYKHFIEIVDNLKPIFVVFENVEGMLSKKVDHGGIENKQVQVIELICDELESKGYSTKVEKSLSERFQVLNAADFGVPQHRKRIFIIANRLGIDSPRLEPTHGPEGCPYKTVGEIQHLPVRLPKISISKKLKNIDVITDNYNKSLSLFMRNIKELTDKENHFVIRQGLKKLYHKLNKEYNLIKDKKTYKFNNLSNFIELYNELVKEYGINTLGENQFLANHQSREHNFRDIIIFVGTKQGSNSSRFMNRDSEDYNEFLDSVYPYDRSKHRDTYVKQSWNKPSNTILAHMEKDGLKFIHPEQPRTLTPYEAQLLQSFPSDFTFCGGRNDQYRQIGNAVPPKLAKVIGESILYVYDKSKTTLSL